MQVGNRSTDKELPEPGPPFEVGERVAFGPTVLGPTTMWRGMEEAVIVDIDDEAETFGFRFVSEGAGVRHGQGLENIVRVTRSYLAWRTAWEQSFARTGDEATADSEAGDLWLRVLAEHPIHGRDLDTIRRGRNQGA